jgi:hypothetical protein
MNRTEHRATVWARGVKGVPASCSCGWKDYAFTTMGAYAMKRKHLAEAQESDKPQGGNR